MNLYLKDYRETTITNNNLMISSFSNEQIPPLKLWIKALSIRSSNSCFVSSNIPRASCILYSTVLSSNIQLELNKYYRKGKSNEIHVINNTTLTLPQKGLVCILGERI